MATVDSSSRSPSFMCQSDHGHREIIISAVCGTNPQLSNMVRLTGSAGLMMVRNRRDRRVRGSISVECGIQAPTLVVSVESRGALANRREPGDR